MMTTMMLEVKDDHRSDSDVDVYVLSAEQLSRSGPLSAQTFLMEAANINAG